MLPVFFGPFVVRTLKKYGERRNTEALLYGKENIKEEAAKEVSCYTSIREIYGKRRNTESLCYVEEDITRKMRKNQLAIKQTTFYWICSEEKRSSDIYTTVRGKQRKTGKKHL